MEKVNIHSKFQKIKDYWNPRIVGELNDQHLKLVKVKGKFLWHKHDNEDEMFIVWKGLLQVELPDKTIEMNEGEFIIIPKGTRHRTIAHTEAHLLLFEPAGTINTGDEHTDMTIKTPEKI
jgi:mannose-6-phosphate isomerase-like protein (cupin superfamily)